jgi:DNA invertase Pin-like site-specific DNA recombinase
VGSVAAKYRLGGNRIGPRSRSPPHCVATAEFESDPVRARTRDGMAVAKAKGRLRGKKPKLSPTQEAHLVKLHKQGTHASAEIAELFGVARSTVYRPLERAGIRPRSTLEPDR